MNNLNKDIKNNCVNDNNSNNYLMIKQLSKSYIGGYTALNNINFSLADGGKLLVFSEVKGGKTTLLSCIAGLESVSSGEIYLNNNLINDLKIKDRDIGYLDSDLHLQKHKKVNEIIAYPLKIRKFDNNTIVEKVLGIANLLNINDILNCSVKQLTNFQKIIVALARLAVLDRKLYLLDDIFNGLTADIQKQLFEIITKLFKNKTLILAVNSLKFVPKPSDYNILLLGYGTVIGYGNIYDREIYFDTLAGVKLYYERKVCAIPCYIDNDSICINGVEYKHNITLKSSVFNEGILCLESDKIAFDNSKNCVITAEIGYINKDKIAYFDIDNKVATIYIGDKKYSTFDKITFSFNIEDCDIYDYNSERIIST